MSRVGGSIPPLATTNSLNFQQLFIGRFWRVPSRQSHLSCVADSSPVTRQRDSLSVLVRNCQYLNNIIEQDHRAIKGRCRPMLGFKSYRTAAVTLAGIELAHGIRKRQFKLGPGRWICWSLKKQWDKALT